MSQAALPWGSSVGRGLGDVRERTTTTPGRLRMLSIVIVCGIGLFWLLGAITIIGTRASVDRLGNRIVPVALGAQRVHAALSDADRLGVNNFLNNYPDPASPTPAQNQETKGEYDLDIQNASQELQRISEVNGLGGAQTDQIQSIVNQINAYAAAMQGARTEAISALCLLNPAKVGTPAVSVAGLNNIPAHAACSAMLAAQTGHVADVETQAKGMWSDAANQLITASMTMHKTILPQVDALDTLGGDPLTGNDAVMWALVTVTAAFFIVGIATLGVIWGTQRFIRRRYRRRNSAGLLLSSLLLVLVIAAMAVQVGVVYNSVRTMRSDSYPRLHNLWQVRAAVSDANADESLGLIARTNSNITNMQSSSTYDSAYLATTRQLAGANFVADNGQDRTLADSAANGDVRFSGLIAVLLGNYSSQAERDAAVKLLRGYEEFVDRDATIRAYITQGNTSSAISNAVGASTTGTAFADVNTAALERIDIEQAQFDSATQTGQPPLAMDIALGLVSVAIIVLVLWAVQPRIDEYRA